MVLQFYIWLVGKLTQWIKYYEKKIKSRTNHIEKMLITECSKITTQSLFIYLQCLQLILMWGDVVTESAQTMPTRLGLISACREPYCSHVQSNNDISLMFLYRLVHIHVFHMRPYMTKPTMLLWHFWVKTTITIFELLLQQIWSL